MKYKSLFMFGGLAIAALVYFFSLRGQIPARILDIQGEPEIFRDAGSTWLPLRRGDLIYQNDRLRTSANQSVSLSFASDLAFALERNSQMKGRGSTFLEGARDYELNLFSGSLLSAITAQFKNRKGKMTLLTPNAKIQTDNAVFRVLVNERTKTDTVVVLSGQVQIANRGQEGLEEQFVNTHEKISVLRGRILEPKPIDVKDWRFAFDAYPLLPREANFQNKQLKLSKKAGSLFALVSEHGDFYQPQQGYFRREFFKDSELNQVLLKAYYDVLPGTAFVGMYMFIKDFDPVKYSHLTFSLKSVSTPPETLYLEFKSGGEILQSFPIRDITEEWKECSIPLRLAGARKLEEIVLYITHSMAANNPQGTLFFKDFELLERKEAY